jgi:hypothetical protein
VRVLSHVEGRIVEGVARRAHAAPPAASVRSDETFWRASRMRCRHPHLVVDALSAADAAARHRLFHVSRSSASLSPAGVDRRLFALVTNHVAFPGRATCRGSIICCTPRRDCRMRAVRNLLFFILLHVCKGIGWLHGRIAEALLVRL